MTAPAILSYGRPRRRLARVPLLFRARDCEDELGIFALSYGKRVGLVHTRSGATGLATMADESGVLLRVPSDWPRVSWEMTSAGSRVRTLLMEPAATNLCLRSEDFGSAPWISSGTVTRTAAAHTASGATLDLLGDNDATTAAVFVQTITLPSGTVVFSIDVRADSAAVTVVKLRSVAVADRGRLLITWAGGVPSVVANVGTYLGAEARADGVYRLYCSAPGVVGAESNQIQVYPAGDVTSAATGTVYAGAVQVVAATSPSSYMRTVASAVTRATDSAYFPLLLPPGPLTGYVRHVNRGLFMQNGLTRRLLHLGALPDVTTDPRFSLGKDANDRPFGLYDDGITAATSITSVLSPFPSIGDVLEQRTALSDTWEISSEFAVNGGVALSGTTASATAKAAFAEAKLILAGGSDYLAPNAFTDIVIDREAVTLDELRELVEVA